MRKETLDRFADKHGGYWAGEHPDFPVEDWIFEARAGDTRLGYWEWAAKQAGEADE